jgi:hypothetical protein
MTKKFDPNATPDCDKLRTWQVNSTETRAVMYASICKGFEQRARIAEEKLRIANLGFLEIDSNFSDAEEISDRVQKQIEQVGK